MITPTVGRVVWFHPAITDHTLAPGGDQPLAALISHVWSDTCVNLAVFDANGHNHSRTSVLLVQDGAIAPEGGLYAEWIPYQLAQTARTGAAEAPLEAAHTAAPEPRDDPRNDPPWDVTLAATDFGFALGALRYGYCVARRGWNGPGQFVWLVPPAAYPAQTGVAKAYFGEGSMVPYRAWLALKTVDDTVSTWAPSVSDCLADDWYLVE